jgi:hypothetical protein
MFNGSSNSEEMQTAYRYTGQLEQKMLSFFEGLLTLLNAHIDRRLVVTFYGLLVALVLHRQPRQAGWLSELGSYLVPENAQAGAKRIQKLLYSRKWGSEELEEFLWVQGDQVVEANLAEGKTSLAIWDESVIEKPESLALEGLGPVRSSKAARLKRIKPGYFNPPGGRPIFTPGFHWLQVVVGGMSGAILPVHLHWWTSRGARASSKREEERGVLWEVTRRWGQRVIHVWDRGFAGSPWLSQAFVHGVRFVLRWPKDYRLVNEQGNPQKAWHISRGKRSWEQRQLWDTRRHCWRKVGVVAFPVTDPSLGQSLWLVVSRQGPGKTPWYLLTSEPAHTPDLAWKIILIYARRWQIEMALRFEKTELGLESLRAFSWEVRLRLGLMFILVHGFLLHLLIPDLARFRQYLLETWCHRNGQRSRDTQAPLYRLRLALALFWSFFPPPRFLRLN